MTDTRAQQYVRACETNNLGLRARLERELETEGRDENARLSAPDALIKAAVWYAGQGIAVFPCEPRGKRPLGSLVPHGLKDATTDRATIIRWWRLEPAANIGAPTGLTFDVIDIDGPEGVGATYGMGIEFPPEIGHSLTSRTAGHHVFIEPTGQGNRAGIYPHVDFRGKGGYVVLAPSHVISEHTPPEGRRVIWTRPLKVAK